MKKVWHKLSMFFSRMRVKYILWKSDRVLKKALAKKT